MKKIFVWITFVLVYALLLASTAFAYKANESHEKMTTSAFKHKAVDNGVRAEFQIMSLASMNMKDSGGATHHVMVKLYDNSGNQPVKEAVGKVKVIGPEKSEQINTLKNYNGILAANFTFNKKGKYGVICLLNINGEKHLFKFWYPHE